MLCEKWNRLASRLIRPGVCGYRSTYLCCHPSVPLDRIAAMSLCLRIVPTKIFLAYRRKRLASVTKLSVPTPTFEAVHSLQASWPHELSILCPFMNFTSAPLIFPQSLCPPSSRSKFVLILHHGLGYSNHSLGLGGLIHRPGSPLGLLPPPKLPYSSQGRRRAAHPNHSYQSPQPDMDAPRHQNPRFRKKASIWTRQ